MNANETKKPIGFDMELTDEQLKDVVGGAGGAGGLYRATYQCPNCKSKYKFVFTTEPPETAKCRKCVNTECSLLSYESSL